MRVEHKQPGAFGVHAKRMMYLHPFITSRCSECAQKRDTAAVLMRRKNDALVMSVSDDGKLSLMMRRNSQDGFKPRESSAFQMDARCRCMALGLEAQTNVWKRAHENSSFESPSRNAWMLGWCDRSLPTRRLSNTSSVF